MRTYWCQFLWLIFNLTIHELFEPCTYNENIFLGKSGNSCSNCSINTAIVVSTKRKIQNSSRKWRIFVQNQRYLFKAQINHFSYRSDCRNGDELSPDNSFDIQFLFWFFKTSTKCICYKPFQANTNFYYHNRSLPQFQDFSDWPNPFLIMKSIYAKPMQLLKRNQRFMTG